MKKQQEQYKPQLNRECIYFILISKKIPMFFFENKLCTISRLFRFITYKLVNNTLR